jgi:hypothetical protein
MGVVLFARFWDCSSGIYAVLLFSVEIVETVPCLMLSLIK